MKCPHKINNVAFCEICYKKLKEQIKKNSEIARKNRKKAKRGK